MKREPPPERAAMGHRMALLNQALHKSRMNAPRRIAKHPAIATLTLRFAFG